MNQLLNESEDLNVSTNVAKIILLTPLVLSFIFALFLTIPATRQFTKFLLTENQPVELLTFASLLFASILGIQLAVQAHRNNARRQVEVFYTLFAGLLFVIAMEEIAWGQWFFGFETPDALKELNQQGELTLHNLDGMHGRTEYLRLTFGLCGLLGLALTPVPFFKHLTPSKLLSSWFILITVTTIPDIWNDYTSSYTNFDALFDFLSELNEMLIGFACVIFIKLNALQLNKTWKKQTHIPATQYL